MTTAGDAIRRARESRRMSVRALARKCGVGQGTIAKAESGDRVPHYATLEKIAKGLGVPVGELTGESLDDARSQAAREAAVVVADLTAIREDEAYGIVLGRMQGSR